MKAYTSLLFIFVSFSLFAQQQTDSLKTKQTPAVVEKKAAENTSNKVKDTTITKAKDTTAVDKKKSNETNKTNRVQKAEKSTSEEINKSGNTTPLRKTEKKEIIDDPTLEGQFNKIYRTSTKYQTYKVISIDKYNTLKKNVLDSMLTANRTIIDKEKQLTEERNKIAELNAKLDKTEAELKIALTKENSILLFGAELSKVTYNLILWSIILILSSLLIYFIVKFSRSNVLTKKAQETLIEVEEEFELHRKKSLEREQKLRRKLQDEINKQRNI